jgi:serine/threonine protein kinase
MRDRLPTGYRLGNYRIEHYLATGTFGAVYSARRDSTGDMVALKVLQAPEGVRIGIDVWVLGEQVCELSHPALLQVHEIHLDGTLPYVSMAFASGGSLAQRLQIEPLFRMTVHEALTYLLGIGEALAYLHERDIVHRGVQLVSVLLTLTGRVQLSGLDLACKSVQLAGVQRIVTAGYAAPEEIDGETSAQSDQYALGCIAYRLLTGEQPSEHMQRHLARCIGDGSIPASLGRAVLRALAETPSSRFECVIEFVTALRATDV